MSERYDANPNSFVRGADQPHVSRYLLARGFISPGEIVVDGACGPGYGSAILAEVAGDVFSYDREKTFSDKWKRDNIQFKVMDLEKIDLGTWFIDTWVAIETIEHLKDPQRFLDIITKIVDKKIIISSPNKNTAGENPFHLTDVKLDDLERMMAKYEDWFLYQTFIQGYNYVAIYVKKGIKIVKI